MYNVKFSNGKIMSFSSKDDIFQYISENWDVETYQRVVKDKKKNINNRYLFVFNNYLMCFNTPVFRYILENIIFR